MSNKPSSKTIGRLSDADKDKIALIYSYRSNSDLEKYFTVPKAIENAKKGKVLFALSAEYKTDISTLTAICRERGVIKGAPRERKAKPIVPTAGWFKPVGCDFKKLTEDFLKSGLTIVEIEVSAPEFQGLKPKEILEGFRGKHGIRIAMLGKRIILTRK